MEGIILALRIDDEKLIGFLKKMGYRVCQIEEESQLTPMLTGKITPNLVLIGAEPHNKTLPLIEFIREQPVGRTMPLIYITKSKLEAYEAEKIKDNKMEVIEAPYSIGKLVSKISTLIRLHKFGGIDPQTASLAEANARLEELNKTFQRDIKKAQQIQQDILPKSSVSFPGLDLGVYYKPLDSVGGDFYFYQAVEDKAFSILIADVTGHGLSAAFIASMTKMAYLASLQLSVKETISSMNNLMSKNSVSEMFVTALLVHFFNNESEIEVARAGHLPLLYYNSLKDDINLIAPDGILLGLDGNYDFETEKVSFNKGDFIVLLTDGFTEAVNLKGEMLGIEGCSQLLKKHKEKTASKIVEGFIADFYLFLQDRLLKDDLTLVVIKKG